MDKYNKVVFFNHGHLGDTILSKLFIREVKKYITANKYYISNNYDDNYILDVVDGHIPISTIPVSSDTWITVDNDTLYFNTWYGTLNQPGYLEQLGLSQQDRQNMRSDDGILYNWSNYLFYFNICLKIYDPELDIFYMNENKENYLLPTPVTKLQVPFLEVSKPKVLIFNQEATSGQADNIDYTQYIQSLVEEKDIIIYTSQRLSTTINNVVQLPDYIEYPDLNKISALSLHCNLICGPGNAPLILTWTKENLQDPNKTYITINCNDAGEAIYFKETACNNIVVKNTYELFQKLKKQL